MSASIEDLAHEISWLKNNFKIYNSGQTYNGIALSLLLAASGEFRPYRTVDGGYRLYLNIVRGSITSGQEITISGVLFDGYQLVPSGSGSASHWAWSYTIPATGRIGGFASGGTIVRMQADVKLTAWPTWADVI